MSSCNIPVRVLTVSSCPSSVHCNWCRLPADTFEHIMGFMTNVWCQHSTSAKCYAAFKSTLCVTLHAMAHETANY